MANQLTNPLGGRGTTGTVAKWSSPTTIGDSILTDSGTAISSSGPIRATGTSATAPAFTGSDTDTGLYFPAANQVRISTAGSLAIAVDASQNVGIGTASPSYKLTIENSDSTAYSTTTQASPTASLRNTYGSAGNTQAILVYSTANYSSVWNTGLVETGGGAYTGAYVWQNRTGASTWAEKMRIDSTGNVGIGTASPQEKLQVYGDLKVGVLASGSYISLGDEATTSRLIGIFRAPGDTLLGVGGYAGIKFTVGAAALGSQTERMRIDAAGNVGIGTASPTGRLHVVGGTAAAATNGAPVTIIAQSAGTGNQNGGNIVLTPGALSGSGSAGVADLSGPTGTGLKLPATPGNADSQTLDAYREDTWTPTLSAAASWGGTQPTVSVARYVRIGSTVHCTVVLVGAPNFSSTYLATTITAPFSATYNAAVPISSGATAFGCAQHNAGGTTLFLPTFGVVGAATFSWTFIV